MLPEPLPHLNLNVSSFWHDICNVFKSAKQEGVIMTSLIKKLEAMLAAVTFAEAGEHETALRFLQESQADEMIPELTQSQKKPVHSKNKIGVMKKLESHFMAATFAEAGDFETARQILPDYKRTQTVLLAIEGEHPTKASFDYAFKLCKRVNASLDILQLRTEKYADANSPSESLSTLLPRLEKEGISYKIIVKTAGVKESLFDYVRVHKDVVTAILDSPRVPNRETESTYWNEAFGNIADKLSVPLVTVSKKEANGIGMSPR
jgi:hypothetical protein